MRAAPAQGPGRLSLVCTPNAADLAGPSRRFIPLASAQNGQLPGLGSSIRLVNPAGTREATRAPGSAGCPVRSPDVRWCDAQTNATRLSVPEAVENRERVVKIGLDFRVSQRWVSIRFAGDDSNSEHLCEGL